MPCTEEWINPNETVAIELNDGTVMLNVRSESTAHRRLVVTSPDGATAWSKPKFDDALLEPICMAGIIRYSYDAGRTWPVNKTIEPGPSMYSDIAVTQNGTIL